MTEGLRHRDNESNPCRRSCVPGSCVPGGSALPISQAILSHSSKVDFNPTFTEIAKMLMFQQVAARAADCDDSI
jgi:hypothetical protein